LCGAAWAAFHTKNTYLAAQYRRLARRIGKKKALVAVGNSILVIAYHVLSRGRPHEDLGGNYFDTLNREVQRNRLLRKLEALGLKDRRERRLGSSVFMAGVPDPEGASAPSAGEHPGLSPALDWARILH
jgi:hypothetical protein